MRDEEILTRFASLRDELYRQMAQFERDKVNEPDERASAAIKGFDRAGLGICRRVWRRCPSGSDGGGELGFAEPAGAGVTGGGGSTSGGRRGFRHEGGDAGGADEIAKGRITRVGGETVISSPEKFPCLAAHVRTDYRLLVTWERDHGFTASLFPFVADLEDEEDVYLSSGLRKYMDEALASLDSKCAEAIREYDRLVETRLVEDLERRSAEVRQALKDMEIE